MTAPTLTPAERRAELRRLAERDVMASGQEFAVVEAVSHLVDASLPREDRWGLWLDLTEALDDLARLHYGELLPRDVAPGNPSLAREVLEADVERALGGLCGGAS
jgi:hypothetical protein